jgi:hypothetical protein
MSLSARLKSCPVTKQLRQPLPRSFASQRCCIRPIRRRQRSLRPRCPFWPFTNLRPILFARVFINLDMPITFIKPVRPIFPRPRNPIGISASLLDVVGLAASRESVKRLTSVAQRGSSSGEGDPADPGRTAKRFGFAFDVHDPRRINLLGHGRLPMPPPALRLQLARPHRFALW